MHTERGKRRGRKIEANDATDRLIDRRTRAQTDALQVIFNYPFLCFLLYMLSGFQSLVLEDQKSYSETADFRYSDIRIFGYTFRIWNPALTRPIPALTAPFRFLQLHFGYQNMESGSYRAIPALTAPFRPLQLHSHSSEHGIRLLNDHSGSYSSIPALTALFRSLEYRIRLLHDHSGSYSSIPALTTLFWSSEYGIQLLHDHSGSYSWILALSQISEYPNMGNRGFQNGISASSK